MILTLEVISSLVPYDTSSSVIQTHLNFHLFAFVLVSQTLASLSNQPRAARLLGSLF